MDIINAINIGKKFGNNTVFDNLNFKVKKGEVVTVVGPSGKGKSTLLRCLIGLENIDSGTIEIDGKILVKDGIYVNSKKQSEILSEVGMVFQNYNLFPNLTVRQNLEIVNNDSKKIDMLLKRFGLYDRKDAYPANISGGQKQRLAIIRAMMLNPKIIFFDEPTSALDKDNRGEIVKLINELNAEKYTIVIVTHDKQFVDCLDSTIYDMT